MRPVSAVAPGVLATTGMESLELVRGAVRHVRPACVLAVDALAAAAPERLCRTFQLSDAGIVPGSGVGNARAALQKRTLGVPVFCLGVPTVLDAGTLGGPRGMIVTPRDIDAQVRFLGRVAADAVNLALHPEISYDDLCTIHPKSINGRYVNAPCTQCTRLSTGSLCRTLCTMCKTPRPVNNLTCTGPCGKLRKTGA